MPSKGFMSPEHLEEYAFSRMQEAMKEGIMKHSDILDNPLFCKEAKELLKQVYIAGFNDASSSIAKMFEDIQKVNGER